MPSKLSHDKIKFGAMNGNYRAFNGQLLRHK